MKRSRIHVGTDFSLFHRHEDPTSWFGCRMLLETAELFAAPVITAVHWSKQRLYEWFGAASAVGSEESVSHFPWFGIPPGSNYCCLNANFIQFPRHF